MAFTQTGLERTFNHKRGGFDTFVYRTADAIATVIADGYFNRKEFGYVSLSQTPHFVDVHASDGYYTVKYDFDNEVSELALDIPDPLRSELASSKLFSAGINNLPPALLDVGISGITVTTSQTALAQATEDIKFLDNQQLYGVSNNSYIEDFFGSARLKTCTEAVGQGDIADYNGEGASQIYAGYTVITDAQNLSFKMGRGGQCNLIVDGKYTSKTNYTLPGIDANGEYLNIAFSTRKFREVTLQIQAGSIAFRGAFTAPLDTIYPPTPRLKAIAFGDSFAEGASARNAGISWPIILGNYFNLNVMASCLASTGFLASSSTYNYLERVNDAVDSNAELVFACSTVNDASLDQQVVKDNVLAWYTQVRFDLPSARIVVLGSAGAVTASKQANEQNVKDAIEGVTDGNLFFVPVMTDPNPPIIGTGKISAPTGDGNADLYITNDDHLNQAGQLFFSRWLSTKILKLNVL